MNLRSFNPVTDGWNSMSLLNAPTSTLVNLSRDGNPLCLNSLNSMDNKPLAGT